MPRAPRPATPGRRGAGGAWSPTTKGGSSGPSPTPKGPGGRARGPLGPARRIRAHHPTAPTAAQGRPAGGPRRLEYACPGAPSRRAMTPRRPRARLRGRRGACSRARGEVCRRARR
eukprot:scaffold568_cov376-Prasinococcus_capsulatus_cf.AAC.14